MMRLWQHAAVAIMLLVPLGTTTSRAANRPPADPFAVPEGGMEKLVVFIRGLSKAQPRDAETAAKTREAILKAADRILAGKPTNEQLMVAVRAKAARLDDAKELAALDEKLTKDGQKNAERVVHVRLAAIQMKTAKNKTDFLKYLEEMKSIFAAGPLQPGDDDAAMLAAGASQRMGDKLAGETHAGLAEILATEPKFARAVKQLQATARRLKLVGNAMRLDGKRLDGKDLGWAKYRGKVVLIDFWATWCGPCRAEIPNIKTNYEKYQAKGFDVIGISIDTINRKQLAEFATTEQVPWTICRDADLHEGMADYYGINSIPQLILVGRDGKVISLNARGPALGPLVEKALAVAVDTTAVAEDDTAKSKGEAAPSKTGDESAAAKKPEATASDNAHPARTWTDTSGKFRVKAKFRGIAGEAVKLELEDGRVISVPLEKLSDDDQECIRQRKY